MTPWKLPLIVTAIAVPTAFAFYFGGPGVGVTVGALVAVAIVVVAVRQRPRGALGAGAEALASPRLLVVAAGPVEEEGALDAVAAAVAAAPRPTVLVLAPARIGFLDRWASDVEGARREAQRHLVLAVAALAKAGIEAEARVGDEDIVQAVEDQLGSFEATEVILVSAAPGEDPRAAEAAAELTRRLRPRFRWITPGGSGQGAG